MKGLALDMSKAKSTILVGKVVADFDATIQNALVNLGTQQGSDRMFTDKGTQLFTRALAGVLINKREAEHACNFAGLATLFFINEHDPNTGQERLRDLRVQPQTFDLFSLKAQVQIKTSAGRTIGVLANL